MSGIMMNLLGAGEAPVILPGEAVFITTGTTTWTCPADVTKVSVLCVGPGLANGGGGGGLTWANGLSVTPGNSYTVVVQAGSRNGSYLVTSFNGNACRAHSGQSGGGSGGAGGRSSDVSGASSYGGGYGGAWGGGAGGYSGNGGDGYGKYNTTTPGTSGSGGGGGGGGNAANTSNSAGGGVGIYGEGSSGSYPGGGGSGGGTSTSGSGTSLAGEYGGGGSLGDNSGSGTRAGGAQGVVRIVWGTGRAFPSTNVDQASSDGNVSTY